MILPLLPSGSLVEPGDLETLGRSRRSSDGGFGADRMPTELQTVDLFETRRRFGRRVEHQKRKVDLGNDIVNARHSVFGQHLFQHLGRKPTRQPANVYSLPRRQLLALLRAHLHTNCVTNRVASLGRSPNFMNGIMAGWRSLAHNGSVV